MSGFHPLNGRLSKHFHGRTLSPEDAYLSYHDVRLLQEDVNCIKDDWLTDNAICFWEEYLEHEYLTAYPKAHIVLLRPTMSQMLKFASTPESLRMVREALPPLTKTTHIFIPINDSSNPNMPEDGSHWSLLLASLIDGVAFHYDSMSESNVESARHVMRQLQNMTGNVLRFVSMRDAPQQSNSSDCGVYVCLILQELLLNRLLKKSSDDRVNMSMRDLPNAEKGRKIMLDVIKSFRKEGEKRRSRSASPFGKKDSRSKSPPRIGSEQHVSRRSMDER